MIPKKLFLSSVFFFLFIPFWSQLRAESVKLAWSPSPEGSVVAGYHVYRSEQLEGPYNRLNKSLIQSPSYSDNTAETGRTYHYVVTTVSRTGNESGYSAALKVLIDLYDSI